MTHDLTTTSVLALFETTKSERESFVLDVVSKIDEGHVDPLKIHLQVKCAEDIIKLLNSNNNYKSAVLEASQNQGEKPFQFHNAKFEIKEVGVKYDWTKCEDPILGELQSKQAVLDAEVKARQDMLKTIPQKGMICVNEETGETFTVYPPAKSSTTSVAVTLK